MNTPTDQSGGDAVRLIFSYEQGTIRLVSQQRVGVAVTGFDAASHVRAGDFVEVRDADGAGLSRVPIHAGLDTSIEVLPDNPEDPIIRVEAPHRKRAFMVVVPVRTAADSVAVVRVGRPADRTTARHPSAAADLRAAAPPVQVRELATFPLDR